MAAEEYDYYGSYGKVDFEQVLIPTYFELV